MSSPVRRVHRMPFGAELRPEGVRFRLWAPSAAAVGLVLGEDCLPLEPAGGGFFERTCAAAAAGSAYRFRIDGKLEVPDPASRHQPQDVHGPSVVIDPESYGWSDAAWSGRDWSEIVNYELHVGSFTPAGSFDGLRRRLDHLVHLGVTAFELMPIAEFAGRRNWGYDGVLPFAPAAAYGTPDELKRLVDEAHARGLAVFLDVVYNHFGPEGNYLHAYAGPFFTDRHRTPWGEAIDFEGAHARTVRDFFIHNALYWLEEFHLDGLRLDAVHAIHDDTRPGFLDELARAVHEGPGRERPVHLALENVKNEAHRLGPGQYTAQWNDDVHHALHCLLTGESDGYYADFIAAPAHHLARALAQGFAWQGEASVFHGRPRGEPSAELGPGAFVNFLQNHDQVGNRAYGERIAMLADEPALRAAVAVLLLAPARPLLFMGEEWAAPQPFPFFCDFGAELGRAVTEGRREEFARFDRFRDPELRRTIPDPNAEATFRSAMLDWAQLDDPLHARWLALYRELLALRRREIVPRLAGSPGGSSAQRVLAERALRVDWTLGDGSRLHLVANLGGAEVGGIELPRGRLLYSTAGESVLRDGRLGAWTAAWWLEEDPSTPAG